MTVKLAIPKLQMSMTEAVLAEWLVEDGALVSQGQPIYSLETDKAVQEIEAPASGALRQSAEPGKTYEVGAEIGEIA